MFLIKVRGDKKLYIGTKQGAFSEHVGIDEALKFHDHSSADRFLNAMQLIKKLRSRYEVEKIENNTP